MIVYIGYFIKKRNYIEDLLSFVYNQNYFEGFKDIITVVHQDIPTECLNKTPVDLSIGALDGH